ncbi:hypothetical protein [Actinokineospora diospyrosa]|uniref:SMI1/KNR4 family protein n=1 Tax=Actinokineospora diospyrosa TaxID=103728 RepID=A0ABT1IMN2_9PSEU|nr:hypothetical protein [Actinokineospora diospyrosa]MCP2273929.1 hypothetical protein [Actinokineospora diospyrosa]
MDDGTALGLAAAEHIKKHLVSPRVRDGVSLRPGLTEAELAATEELFGFEFADDHRAMLGEVLPVGGGWPDWRLGDIDPVRRQVDWPVDGVLFDVSENEFWHRDWGPRPPEVHAAVEVARTHLATVPRMIPIVSHRCLPGGRGTSGYPVLSMYQTDIIYYGDNLLSFFTHADKPHVHPKPIRFWDDLL